ncbi:MAG TPA: hypothetical protein VLW17_14420 [Thermoanaerobaculaceae bacterium]|nr:hypothetical protein [Thermoanaerobaculaceae bacterium]
MAYTASDLTRRFNLGRTLLSPYPAANQALVGLTLSGPGRTLNLPFPADLKPKPATGQVGNPNDPLPTADVVVLTYTSDEAKALADVMSPGKFSHDWTHYAHNYKTFLPNIRKGAPSRMAGRLGSYWTTSVGGKSILLFKSELHLHQDVFLKNGKPTMPIKDLFHQIIDEAKPGHFFCIGTAGGTCPDRPLGTVAASRAVRFICKKDFAKEKFANAQFQSNWTVPTTFRAQALSLMKAFMDNLVVQSAGNYASCPCHALQGGNDRPPKPTFLLDGAGGVPKDFPVLTTDFFEFGTDRNHLEKLGLAVEMDDAVFGLACSELAAPPKWLSIRNYSDPVINAALKPRAQESCAAKIYLRYGYWTSVMGAIGTWSIIAGL